MSFSGGFSVQSTGGFRPQYQQGMVKVTSRGSFPGMDPVAPMMFVQTPQGPMLCPAQPPLPLGTLSATAKPFLPSTVRGESLSKAAGDGDDSLSIFDNGVSEFTPTTVAGSVPISHLDPTAQGLQITSEDPYGVLAHLFDEKTDKKVDAVRSRIQSRSLSVIPEEEYGSESKSQGISAELDQGYLDKEWDDFLPEEQSQLCSDPTKFWAWLCLDKRREMDSESLEKAHGRVRKAGNRSILNQLYGNPFNWKSNYDIRIIEGRITGDSVIGYSNKGNSGINAAIRHLFKDTIIPSTADRVLRTNISGLGESVPVAIQHDCGRIDMCDKNSAIKSYYVSSNFNESKVASVLKMWDRYVDSYNPEKVYIVVDSPKIAVILVEN